MIIRKRLANLSDLKHIMNIQTEMYGEDYQVLKPTYEAIIDQFPSGSTVAIDSKKNDEIKGFILTERIKRYQAIPNVHNPLNFHVKDGPILYVSGFGVKRNCAHHFKVGYSLYEIIVKFGKKIKVESIFVLCNKNTKSDSLEMKVLNEFNFEIFKKIEWEILPNRKVKHDSWVKHL